MLATLATLSAHTTRRYAELGALLGLIAGIAVVAAAMPGLRRVGLTVGGILLIVGFGLIIYALHFGTTL